MTWPAGSPSDVPKEPASLEERLRPYAWAIVATLVGVALREVLNPILGTNLPFITVFPAVFIAAYLGGLGPTLLATALSVLAAAYLFMEPRLALALTDPVAQVGITLFALSGLLVGSIGESRLRAHRRVVVAVALSTREAARAEEEAVRAEEEATRAEEERLRA